jgi:hypothetical protein
MGRSPRQPPSRLLLLCLQLVSARFGLETLEHVPASHRRGLPDVTDLLTALKQAARVSVLWSHGADVAIEDLLEPGRAVSNL